MRRHALTLLIATALPAWTAFQVAAAAPAAADKPNPDPAPTPAAVEKRLADLERQVEATLKEIRQLRQELARGPAAGGPKAAATQVLTVIALRHASADRAAEVVRKVLPAAAEGMVVDVRTNSLLLRGTGAAVADVKDLLLELDGGKRN